MTKFAIFRKQDKSLIEVRIDSEEVCIEVPMLSYETELIERTVSNLPKLGFVLTEKAIHEAVSDALKKALGDLHREMKKATI